MTLILQITQGHKKTCINITGEKTLPLYKRLSIFEYNQYKLSMYPFTVPDKCCPWRSTIQTVLVKHYCVSSERRLKCLFFFGLLSWGITAGYSSEESHQC